jgi:hypothetical protein
VVSGTGLSPVAQVADIRVIKRSNRIVVFAPLSLGRPTTQFALRIAPRSDKAGLRFPPAPNLFFGITTSFPSHSLKTLGLKERSQVRRMKSNQRILARMDFATDPRAPLIMAFDLVDASAKFDI